MDMNVPTARTPSRNHKASWNRLAPIHRQNVAENGFGKRLAQVRLRHGYESAREAAHKIGISHVTYYHHENGRRNPSVQAVEIYAGHFKVSADWLLYGEKTTVGRSVPVVGAVSPGGKVVDPMLVAAPLPTSVRIVSENPGELLSLVVETDDLYPAYRPGDVVIYAKPACGPLNPAEVNGRECVVVLTNGQTLLRICHADPDGYWTLECYHARTIQGARLASASPVISVQREACTHQRQRPSA